MLALTPSIPLDAGTRAGPIHRGRPNESQSPLASRRSKRRRRRLMGPRERQTAARPGESERPRAAGNNATGGTGLIIEAGKSGGESSRGGFFTRGGGGPGAAEPVGPSVGSRLEKAKQSKYLRKPAEVGGVARPMLRKRQLSSAAGPPPRRSEWFSCLSNWDAFKKGLALIAEATEAAAVDAK
ncbi:hypothetical protein SKAU_G00057660 [Synaphobranchus kaupii]|uniref:Uncharacterized protein n=1 Tax=Synaphobranchus kaupii TaxID=118154 RepID=A0A9Q1G546_SYNKA|nr:hypothetical protein SKAU_G00057660 [Synaphobranchus kaupii]